MKLIASSSTIDKMFENTFFFYKNRYKIFVKNENFVCIFVKSVNFVSIFVKSVNFVDFVNGR